MRQLGETFGKYRGRLETVAPRSDRETKYVSFPKAPPMPKEEHIAAEQEARKHKVETAVTVTRLMLRVAERDKLTAKLRDQAQAMLLSQWLRQKAVKEIVKELIFRQ